MALTAINSDGWSATYSAPPAEFDPVAAPETLAVTRAGFDQLGNAIAPVDTLTIMKRIRLPYPDQLTLTADQASLSNYVYAGDTIAGVTNNSTRPAPKPICMWLDHDRQRATGGTYTAKLAVAHGHARNGRPVAAVKFIATDGVTTVEQVVSAMSSTSYVASGLTVPHFEAALDLSTLTANALITIDAVIFPWVGAAYQASVDGVPYPSINFSTMRVLNDVSYGTAYAYVDAALGDNGTAVTSEVQATAQAAPYATIAAAAAGVQAYNSANLGRNSASGGVVRLNAGTHIHSSYSSVVVTDVPLVIEAANPANKATTIYQDAGASASNGCPDLLKVKDVTLRRSAGDYTFISSSAPIASVNMFVAENVHFDDAGVGSFWAAWVYNPGRVWLIESTSTDVSGLTRIFSSANKTTNIIGSRVSAENSAFHVAGTRSAETLFLNTPPVASREGVLGGFVGFNFMSDVSSGAAAVSINESVGSDGHAIVGNIFEKVVTASAQLLNISGDGNTNPFQNIVMSHNTAVGERTNYLYNDAGNAVKSGYLHSNVFKLWNVKSDVFASDGLNVGNWSVIYHAADSSNAYLLGSNNDDIFSVGSWLGEVQPINAKTGTDAVPINPDWVNDSSIDGTGLGGGDYTPGPANELQTIPAGDVAYPVDLLGRTIAVDGTALVGAVQVAVATNITATMSATETGHDGAAVSVAVDVGGSVAATDTGGDVFSASVAVAIGATVDAIEAGEDGASIVAEVSVAASLAAQEVGADIAAIQVATSVGMLVQLAAVESGSDTAAVLAEVGVGASAALAEAGEDTLAAQATVAVGALIAAVESGDDEAAIDAAVSVTAQALIEEVGADQAAILMIILGAFTASNLRVLRVGSDARILRIN